MTTEKLQRYTARDLAQMAKKKGVVGWHSMTKAQLIRALVKASKSSTRSRTSATSRSSKRTTAGKSRSAKATARGKSRTPAKSQSTRTVKRKEPSPYQRRRLAENRRRAAQTKDLTTGGGRNGRRLRDRLVVMVRDPFWLHAFWELTRKSVERAEAALGQDWHGAKPVLRLLRVGGQNTTTTTESLVRTIEIHGGVNNWYIHVESPPQSFRLDIGYQGPSGRFHSLARSNVVTTPKAGAADELDENWTDVAENFEKIWAMSSNGNGNSGELQELFEERLRRPMGDPVISRFGAGATGVGNGRKQFGFEVDAEMIIYGQTEPNANVTLQGDPVQLRPDGSFTVRFNLPNCRQVIPAVASTADGVEQRTVVLAVERNTKVMEPLIRDADD